LTDVSNSFRFFKLADMAKYILRGQGVAVDFLSPMDLAGRALHSTSDFVKVLENVANKTLRDAYQESPQTFNAFTRRVENSDFKEISRVQLGDFPKFQEKTEGGEYVYGTVGEGAEKYKIKTYGVIVGLTREALINDDLNSFARVPDMAGRQAANLESDLVYAILNSNPTMADGFALFSSQHANLASGGDVGAPSVTTLGVAREAMRLQKSLNGSHLNLVPVSLIVPANHETAADQIVTQITPAQTSNVNPFAMAGRTPLSPVVEPRLDATSVNAWYLAAAISQVDIIELCTMTGEAMPVIDSMVDFDTDGVKFKARHTVGTKAIDYRGIYKNPGV
jgi:phage major head subunit gpT-like protein